MPNITDLNAISFSNQTARVIADDLSRCYYLGVSAKQQYEALGGGAPALADTTVLNAIREAADQWASSFLLCYEREKEWFLKGATSFIPNTTDQIIDNSPGDGRPMATGAKVVAVLARATEFINSIQSSTGSFSDATRNSAIFYNRVIAASNRGLASLSVVDAQNFVDMITSLKTNYEANTNQNLNSLLVLAVNPNGG